jgi:NADH-quinone oxidoreductase subunit C
MPEEKPPEPPKPGEGPAAEKPASESPAAKAAPASPSAQPAAAAKPHVEKPALASPGDPVGEPWTGEIVDSLQKTFPEIGIRAFTYLKQNYLILPRESILPVAIFLKTELHFTLLADLTAADYPQRERRFDVVYQLYSFSRNERLRVKARVGEQETIESVVPVWSGADWMEREVFDMFGIRFEHHPNMKRILLPDEWEGHPLRKEYGILQQDNRWVQENLHIESGQ